MNTKAGESTMNFRRLAWTAIALGALGLAPNAFADGVSRGALLASMCNTCHGTEGAGAKPMPGIAGETVADFVDIMQAFASGDEPTSIMDRHAQGYTEDDIRAMAEYFANK